MIPEPIPSIDRGRVHVVYRLVRANGTDAVDRPALVTEAWEQNQSFPEWKGKVNLLVFQDGSNDYDGLAVWKGSVEYDQTGRAPGTWRWPRGYA